MIYVNHINYGGGHYGCEEASQHYFGKSVSEIDLAEAAFLAGVPQRPESHSPYKNPESAKSPAALRAPADGGARLHRQGHRRRRGQAAHPGAAPPAHRDRATPPRRWARVQRVLAEKYSPEVLPTLGATVKTTLDLPLQKLARESLERGLEGVDQRQGYRGPSGHLDGAKLEQYRYELKLAREAGQGGDAAKAAAAPQQAPPAPRPAPAGRLRHLPGGGRPGRAGAAPAAQTPGQSGRLIVDIGGRQGVVDLADEPRYTRGPKPWLVDRFKPGDLVRVRLAGERRQRPGEQRRPRSCSRWPSSWDPRRPWWCSIRKAHEVLALVGGYNYRAGGYDRSQRAARQPGSAFKPFVYAAALDAGRAPPPPWSTTRPRSTTCGSRRTTSASSSGAR